MYCPPPPRTHAHMSTPVVGPNMEKPRGKSTSYDPGGKGGWSLSLGLAVRVSLYWATNAKCCVTVWHNCMVTLLICDAGSATNSSCCCRWEWNSFMGGGREGGGFHKDSTCMVSTIPCNKRGWGRSPVNCQPFSAVTRYITEGDQTQVVHHP